MCLCRNTEYWADDTKSIYYRVLVFNATYISYIVAVSFIGGGNQSMRRKPLTCRKSLTNLILYRVHLTWGGFELTTLVPPIIGEDILLSLYTEYKNNRSYISLNWSNDLLASCSNFLSLSEGLAPSSSEGKYSLLHGDLKKNI